MAAATVEESSSKALKCQTWVLKVSIHCQGCKRKVEKVLLGIDGVYTATVDSQQQRVTVIGNIELETLVKRLTKIGKHAEIWPEKFPSKEKQAGKPNNKQKQNNSSSSEKKKAIRFSEEAEDVGKSAENSTVSEVKNNVSENEGVSGVKNRANKKKKNGQTRDNSNSYSASASPSSGKAAETAFQPHGMGINQAMGPSNLSPTCHQSAPYPRVYNIPQPYAYSNPGPFFYTPISPYAKVTPLDSFFYFSDENVQGCSIM